MKIKIIYETQTGTTQYVAELMKKQFDAAGHSTDLHSVRINGTEPNLDGYDLVIFGAPTYDDGMLESGMRVFITKYNVDLSRFKIAVFGLGNHTYPQFCTAAPILTEWVKKNNGVPLVDELKIDGFPDDVSPIQQWVAAILTKITTPATPTA